MPNNCYEPDTIPKFCYFTYFKTYHFSQSIVTKYYQCINWKLENFTFETWKIKDFTMNSAGRYWGQPAETSNSLDRLVESPVP